MKVLVIEMSSYHCLTIKIHLQIDRLTEASSTQAAPGGGLLDNITKRKFRRKVIHCY